MGLHWSGVYCALTAFLKFAAITSGDAGFALTIALELLIALTGFGREEDRRRSREAGFAEHLVKPVDPDALIRMIAEMPIESR